MPKLIQNAEFSRKLWNPERNHEDAKYFLQQGVTAYSVAGLNVPEGYRLLISLKSYKKDGSEIKKIRLIYDGGNAPEIVYAVNLAIGDNVINGKHCTQVIVWRTMNEAHEESLFMFVNKMFFHFIDKYVVIISDTEQTEDGRTLWTKRISEAFQRGLDVYFVDLNKLNSDLVPVLNHVETVESFRDIWADHRWGKSEDYKDRLFVI